MPLFLSVCHPTPPTGAKHIPIGQVLIPGSCLVESVDRGALYTRAAITQLKQDKSKRVKRSAGVALRDEPVAYTYQSIQVSNPTNACL